MTPQHLQAQDQYHLTHTRELVRAWVGESLEGVIHLQYDDARLLDNLFTLRAAQVVFGSGEPWFLREQDPALTLVLPDAADYGTHSLRIFLTLANSSSATASASAQNYRRYETVECELSDLHAHNDDTVAIKLGYVRPTLCCLEQLDQRSEALEVARLRATPEGGWVREQDFVPQCLHFLAAGPLVTALHERMRVLQQRRASWRAAAETGEDARGAAHSARQIALDQALVTLGDMLFDPTLKPRAAFVLMRRAAAGLLPWVPDVLCAPLVRGSEFAPAELMHSFAPLMAIFDAFAAGQPDQRVWRKPFDKTSQGDTLRVSLQPQQAAAFDQWLLAVQVLGAPAEEIALHVAAVWPRLAKLAAPSELGLALSAALSAVPLRHIAHTPQGLARRDDVVFLAIDTNHPSWLAGLGEGAVALEPPRLRGVTQEVRVELVGLRDTPTGRSA